MSNAIKAASQSTEVGYVPTKQQCHVVGAWHAFNLKSFENDFGRSRVYNPQFRNDGSVVFEWSDLGLISVGVEGLAEFARFLQDFAPAFDFSETILYVCMNGTLFPALPGDDKENCKATVERVQREKREAYEKTPEYAAAQERKALQEAEADTEMQAVLKDFRMDFDHLDMGRWLARYISAGDRIGAKVDLDEMYSRFERMGYVRNEGVTNPPTKPVGLEASIRYIVGQVMSFHKPEDANGFGPCVAHPMLGEWATDAVRLHLQTSIKDQ
jgi:hypothetical protein